MELLVIRHAKAEDHGHPGGDGERALVAKRSVMTFAPDGVRGVAAFVDGQKAASA